MVGNLRQGEPRVVEFDCFTHLLCRQGLATDNDVGFAEDAENGGLGDTVFFGESS